MAEQNYKADIANTRVGCVGSSDSKMLAQILRLGCVPKSAYKRLAVLKGFIENEDIPHTDAVRFGDEIEQQIFEYLHENDSRFESNPLWVSEKYSRKNVKCITHPDFVLQDDKSKVLSIFECKGSKHTTEQLRQEYKCQLFHHLMLGRERASSLGRDWKVKLFLVHYSTEGLDLSQNHEFDSDRMSVREVRMGRIYDLSKAMDMLDEFLEGFVEYYPEDEVPEEMLPDNVKEKFGIIAKTIKDIEEKKQYLEDFKSRLYSFMKEKEIKSIKCDSFSIVRVDSSKQSSFDFKKFLDDERRLHPTKTKRLESKYQKITVKKGYCTIKVNRNKDVEDIFK